MKHLFYTLILLSVILTNCKNKNQVSSTSDKAPNPVEEVTETEDVIENGKRIQSPIVNKYWKAVEIMGEQVVVSEDMKQEPYLNLVEVGSVSGHTGCNRFFGKFTITDKRFIQFHDIAMTEMDCSFKNYDIQLAEAMSMARQFIVTGNQMQLIVGKRAPLAIFKELPREEMD